MLSELAWHYHRPAGGVPNVLRGNRLDFQRPIFVVPKMAIPAKNVVRELARGMMHREVVGNPASLDSPTVAGSRHAPPRETVRSGVDTPQTTTNTHPAVKSQFSRRAAEINLGAALKAHSSGHPLSANATPGSQQRLNSLTNKQPKVTPFDSRRWQESRSQDRAQMETCADATLRR